MKIFLYFMRMMIYAEELIFKKIKNFFFNAKAIHQHGQGKSVQNLLKRTFLITLI